MKGFLDALKAGKIKSRSDWTCGIRFMDEGGGQNRITMLELLSLHSYTSRTVLYE